MTALAVVSSRTLNGYFVPLLLALGLTALSVATQAQDSGELTVRAQGFKHAGGQAVAKLFIAGDSVLGPGRWQVRAAIEGGAAVFRFPGLVARPYAVVVFHDENRNGEIDHGLLGPSEAIGFSGGFVLSWTSGRPDFERLQFEFKPPAQTLEVRLP